VDEQFQDLPQAASLTAQQNHITESLMWLRLKSWVSKLHPFLLLLLLDNAGNARTNCLVCGG